MGKRSDGWLSTDDPRPVEPEPSVRNKSQRSEMLGDMEPSEFGPVREEAERRAGLETVVRDVTPCEDEPKPGAGDELEVERDCWE